MYPLTKTRSMPAVTTGTIDRAEVITWVSPRRRWSAEEKAAMVQETDALGMSVWLVAQQRSVTPHQVFKSHSAGIRCDHTNQKVY